MTIKKRPVANTDRARAPGRDSTEAERKLWSALRSRRSSAYKFRRQFPIGPYIADFAGFAHRVIVELDGGQHAQQASYDDARTRHLEAEGFLEQRRPREHRGRAVDDSRRAGKPSPDGGEGQ